MKLLLALHGVTDWNHPEFGKLQGHTDTEINDLGREQARHIGNSLAGEGVDRIVGSDLKRAADTAHIIADILRIPLSFDSRLRECLFGSLEGLNKLELGNHYTPSRQDIPGAWYGSFVEYDFRSSGGESRDEVLQRHKAVVRELIRLYPAEKILLVGHGMGFNTLLADLGMEPNLDRGEWREISVG